VAPGKFWCLDGGKKDAPKEEGCLGETILRNREGSRSERSEGNGIRRSAIGRGEHVVKELAVSGRGGEKETTEKGGQERKA